MRRSASGGAAIADDSGLCVDALGGAPGVVSAHYAPIELPAGDREAQRRAQDAANNALLLERMHGVRRPARALRQHAGRRAPRRRPRAADRDRPLAGRAAARRRAAAAASATTRWSSSRRSARSVAELDAATKNAHSHRALAARQMLALMREAWRLG